MAINKNPASFRDPDSTVYQDGNQVFRCISNSYKNDYDYFLSCGLKDTLICKKMLIEHQEIEVQNKYFDDAYKILSAKKIPFISYPYEWSFSQLKDAALLTLDIQTKALNKDMSLKDASAFNVQFMEGKPIFIDTASFEKYEEGSPWVAYKQFCQHFLAPLALVALVDTRLGFYSKINLDGIPLELASKLLPITSYFKYGLLAHIHLHAKFQLRYSDSNHQLDTNRKRQAISKSNLLALIESLKNTVISLNWHSKGTEWGNYYNETNYDEVAMNHKMEMVNEYLSQIKPNTVWDFGANNGKFSKLAEALGAGTVSYDIDPLAVEYNYLQIKSELTAAVKRLPLIMDLVNPSASLGWSLNERMSLTDRGPVDCVMALALIHHLAISNNVPLQELADFFSKVSNSLIIEFVPKSDSQVKRLLKSRVDIFNQYTEIDFENIFKSKFKIIKKMQIKESTRTIYLMTTIKLNHNENIPP